MSENAQVVELPALFKSLVKKMTQEWKNRVPDNLSMSQFRVLYVLNSEGRKKTTELADILGVTSGAVTGIADKLIDRGFVRRNRDEEDRRVVFLHITNDGKEMVETLLDIQKETMNAFFGSLPEEDIEHLKRIFTFLLDQFGQKDEG